MQLKLVRAQRPLEIEVEAAVELGFDRLVALEDVVRLLARGGDAARDVGGHEELRRIEAMLGKCGDAHARPQHRGPALVGDRPVECTQQLHRGKHRLARVREPRQDDADLLVADGGEPVVGAQRLVQALEHELHGGGGRRTAQQRLQPVDAPQLEDEHGEAPVGGARDRRLAIEEPQQLLARLLRCGFRHGGGGPRVDRCGHGAFMRGRSPSGRGHRRRRRGRGG